MKSSHLPSSANAGIHTRKETDMLKIRQSIFETNSSSVHAIAYCTTEEFQKFMDGELMFDIYDEKLIPFEKQFNSNFYTYRELERIRNDYYCDGTASAELKELSDGTKFGVIRYDREE